MPMEVKIVLNSCGPIICPRSSGSLCLQDREDLTRTREDGCDGGAACQRGGTETTFPECVNSSNLFIVREHENDYVYVEVQRNSDRRTNSVVNSLAFSQFC